MEECCLRIDSLAAGGDGVGRDADGRVVFVPFSAPGDRLRVRIDRSRRRHAHGSVLEILEAGPGRTDPRCPYFGRCGGCAWQHLEYPVQCEAKAGILHDALVRIGGFEALETPPLRASPAAYGYRSRARVQVEAGAVGYRQGRSNELCAVDRCPVLVAPLDAKLAELAAAPPSSDGEWELAVGGGAVRAAPVGGKDVPALTLEVGDERIRYSAGVFAQSNALLLGALSVAVAEASGQGEDAVELYAGAGLLTLPLARRFARLTAVEGHGPAATDLRENLANAGIANVDVRAEPVDRVLHSLAGAAPEALVLDPPRSGLPPDGAKGLAAVEARRIVYLSCDPATLARDLRILRECDYALRSVEGFDLFPQTPHVEALAVLERA